MKRTFPQNILVALLVSLSVAFVACSNDNPVGANNVKVSDGMTFATQGELPMCTKLRSGYTVFVQENNGAYVCENYEWVMKSGGVANSKVTSSQSSVNSASSSATIVTPEDIKTSGYYKTNCPAGRTCKYVTEEHLNPGIAYYGEYLDTRDDQVYKTIRIDDQYWIAQNLNYEVYGSKCGGGSGSRSYAVEGDCDVFGRLYSWTDAKEEVCPSGWHLPSYYEMFYLGQNVGSSPSAYRSKSSLWRYFDQTGTTQPETDDKYGFSVIPAGIMSKDGSFSDTYSAASFWTSSVYEYEVEGVKFVYGLYMNAAYVSLSALSMDAFYSVRCIKD